MNHRNAAEPSILTLNNHLISVLSPNDPDLTISEWDQLLFQCIFTLNILRNSKVNPDLSAYAYIYGPYDFNKYPVVPPGTHVIVHKKPGNFTSWVHHFTPGWYIGPSLDHYRFMHCDMPTTGIVSITDTLQYIPRAFVLPKTTTEDYIQQAIGYIIEIIRYPPNIIFPPMGMQKKM